MLKKTSVFICVALFSCNLSKEKSLTKLKVIPEEVNFGKIKQDSIYKGVFYIKNVGDNTLEIYNVISGCGCTVVKLEQRKLQAGDSVPIKFEFNSRGKFGIQDRSISIFGNTKDTIQFFTIKGEVTK